MQKSFFEVSHFEESSGIIITIWNKTIGICAVLDFDKVFSLAQPHLLRGRVSVVKSVPSYHSKIPVLYTVYENTGAEKIETIHLCGDIVLDPHVLGEL